MKYCAGPANVEVKITGLPQNDFPWIQNFFMLRSLINMVSNILRLFGIYLCVYFVWDLLINLLVIK
jgi:hypothetical protein